MNKREKKYIEEKMTNLRHATLDPNGPGAVTIHLIPSLKKRFYRWRIAILNGQYVVPLPLSGAIMLNELLIKLEDYAGSSINELEIEEIIKEVIDSVTEIYPRRRKKIEEDLKNLIGGLVRIAQNKNVKLKKTHTIFEYSKIMKSPIRMDLMVSAMEKRGKWNCNQKCLHCYAANQHYAEVKELSANDWFKVIDKLGDECSISQLTFTGGEPTIRKDLPEIIGHASKFYTRLNTNGRNLTKDLCEKLYDANLDSVQVTLYSSNPKIHNKLVGVNGYSSTIEGIKNALAANLSVSVNTPLCELNRDYVKTLKFLNKLGVRYVTCSGLIETGNACSEDSKITQMNHSDFITLIFDAKMFCDDNDMEISFTTPGLLSHEEIEYIELNMEPMCGACFANMAIAPDGTVVPCQSWLSEEAKLGNILLDSWDSIWYSELSKKIREENAKGRYMCPLSKN